MDDASDNALRNMRAIKPKLIDLKIPMLEAGMSRDMLCSGENSTVRIHCYSTGMGEKHGLHAHIEEEHVFIVLHGQAVFSSIEGKLPPLGKNKGIWLPKGCFYEFVNPGPEPLVVLRFGADACPTENAVSAVARRWGYEVAAESLAIQQENGHVEWRFVAVAVSKRTAASVGNLARDLMGLPGVESYQLSPARN